MSFADFIVDEEDGKKKRKQVEDVIKKAVKSKLIDVTETEDACIINFESNDELVIKPTTFQVIVTLDYRKKIYRGMIRAIYVNVVKHTNSYRTTDSICIDIHEMNEGEFAKTLDGIKKHFEKLCLTNS